MQGSTLLRRPLRIALYGHDTQGLGHLRRNLCLADVLGGASADPSVLICAGVVEARSYALPAGTDLVTLPALHKDEGSRYSPRSLGGSTSTLLHLRTQILLAALTAFQPDVLVVDKVALGVLGELEPALVALRAAGTTRVVLGLRDILDAPVAARHEWATSGTTEAIRSYYDAVWVYGDRRIADTVVEYGLPDDVAALVSFAGYLAEGRAPSAGPDATTRRILAAGPYALCLVGGGQDGAPLARTFLRSPLPAGVRGVVVMGPFMDVEERAELAAIAATVPGREVRTFVPEPSWLIRSATAVVAMAGYNTVCELLEAKVPAVLVPRVRPRREQQVRAQRLAALDLAECLLPDALTPATLGTALARAVDRPPSPAGAAGIDLDGIARLPHLLDALTSPAMQEDACATA